MGASGTALAACVTGVWARSQTKLQLATQERHMERQLRAEHATQLREPRRKVYAEFVMQGEAELHRLSEAVRYLEQEPFAERPAFDRLQTDGALTDFDKAALMAQLEGPEDIAYAVNRVVHSVSRARRAGLIWALERAGRPLPEEQHPADETRAAVDGLHLALSEFRLVAMQVIRGDGSDPESDQVWDRATRYLSDFR